MMITVASRIETAIREHLAPVLRADGFAGSGRTFRRVVGDWIQVVNVQGSRYGGQFAVNLGLQPSCIPDVKGNVPNPKKITVDLCEFRRRMSDSTSREDKWWKHDATDASTAAAVLDAARTYSQTGRSLLAEATADSADLNMVSVGGFAAGKFDFLGFGSAQCRMAFAMARLRKAQGLSAEAREFANHALACVGTASLLRAEIEAFLCP